MFSLTVCLPSCRILLALVCPSRPAATTWTPWRRESVSKLKTHAEPLQLTRTNQSQFAGAGQRNWSLSRLHRSSPRNSPWSSDLVMNFVAQIQNHAHLIRCVPSGGILIWRADRAAADFHRALNCFLFSLLQASRRLSGWNLSVPRTTPLICTTLWTSPTPWTTTWKTLRTSALNSWRKCGKSPQTSELVSGSHGVLKY